MVLVPTVISLWLMLKTAKSRYFCANLKCRKYIPGDQPWKCGHCNFENLRSRAFPFFLHCERCKSPPSAVRCPYCAEPFAIDADASEGLPATLLYVTDAANPPPGPAVDPRRERFVARKTEFQEEIELAKLEKELMQIRQSPEFKKEVSEQEKVGKHFSELQAKHLSVRMLEREKREEAASVEDPELREDMELVIDEFMRQQGLEPSARAKEKGSR